MRVTVIVLVTLLLTACASEDYWLQKGKREPDMQIDRFDCETQLRDRYGFYGADNRTSEYVKDLRECMTAKGYTLVEQKKKK
jgi:hypothetical protein